MSNIVLLVGAGATLAEALPKQPSTRRTPPLDATFLELCFHSNLEGVPTLQDYMFSNYGIDPFAGGYRMEEIFNFVYSDVFTGRADDTAIEAYWALLKMYRIAIAQTTNWIRSTGRSGVGSLIKRLWVGNHPSITIVTFNQDLVIEKALEKMTSLQPYSNLPWDIHNCYEMRFEEFLYSSQATFFKSRGQESVRILKLHGSLNWFYLARSAEDAKNSIRQPGTKLYCLANRRILSGLTYKAHRRSDHLLPLIVPPVFEKSARYRTSLAKLWRLAREAIEQADRLFIFGYSFPEGDFAARSLLRSAFHSSNLEEVTVIDSSPAVAGRISALLGSPCHHYFDAITSIH